MTSLSPGMWHHAVWVSCIDKFKARRALATLVAQLFSCPDGEHCFIRERAHWQLFCCGNKKVAAGCSQTHSRGNRNVADNDRTLMFQSVRARWQLNSCLLAAVSCTSLVSWVIQLSIVEDIEKLICEVERRPPLYNKKIERIQRQKSEG